MKRSVMLFACACVASCSGSKPRPGGAPTIASAYDPNPPGCTHIFDRKLALALPDGWRVSSPTSDTPSFTLTGEPRVTVTVRHAFTSCDQQLEKGYQTPPFFGSDWTGGETIAGDAGQVHGRVCQELNDEKSSALTAALVVDVVGDPSLEKDPRVIAMTRALHWEGRNASRCVTPALCISLPGTGRQMVLPAGWTMTPDPMFAEVAQFTLAGYPGVKVAMAPTGTSTCAEIELPSGARELLRPAYVGEAWTRHWGIEDGGRETVVSCTDGQGGASRIHVELPDEELGRSYRLHALTDGIAGAAYGATCDTMRERMKI